ncbi:MAG: group 1 glycosyl transferase [uncultured bacterium]|nr:MAG: group 1 glycosyl transferase [uncultured bacterium]
MKVWIDCSFALKNKTGVGAYILSIIEALKESGIIPNLIFCRIFENIPYKAIPYFIWLNTVFYIKTLIEKPDVIFFPAFFMPFFKRKNTKYITVIHDLAPYNPKFVNSYISFIYKLAINIAIRKADTIITISEAVRQELITKFSIPEEKIKLTSNCVGEHFLNENQINGPDILQKYGLTDKKYVFSAATFNKRKNMYSLIEAFSLISAKYPDIKLVLAGAKGNDEKLNHIDNENVIFTGYVKDEELPILYKHSLIYVFPSLYEGFGIPILEAQATETPIIASNIPVFREVAANGAVFCIPTSKNIAKKIELLIADTKLRQSLIEAGKQNLSRFSSDILAKQIKEILDI